MESIFTKSKEMKIKGELERAHFDDMLEKGIQTCQLEESLELLLYDVGDAIREKQILLIEAGEGKEEAYLIPCVLAYQNASTFNRFIIAASSKETREKIISKLSQISSLLGIEIPVHTIDTSEEYLCLRRLKKHARKRNELEVIKANEKHSANPGLYRREDFEEMSEQDWKKIHVKICSLYHCKFYRLCKYALDYQSIKQNGCVVLPHQTLIGNERYTQSETKLPEEDLIIIDEGENLSKTIRSAYQNSIYYDVVKTHFQSASRYLSNIFISEYEEQSQSTLKAFFRELYQNNESEDALNTNSIRQKAKVLAMVAQNLHIQLTKQLPTSLAITGLDHLSDILFVIYCFFNDIALGQPEFDYQITGRKLDLSVDTFKKVEVYYYPKHVHTIVSNALSTKNSSIVITGTGISEDDNSYGTLCQECGIEQLKTEVVKEYTLKK